MKTIYKYHIGMREKVRMPEAANILHVGEQDNHVFIWCLVDTAKPSEERVFTVFGTGWSIDETPKVSHVGSVVMPDGLVWHVFEEGGSSDAPAP